VELDPSNIDLRFFRDTVRKTKESFAKARLAAAQAEACLNAGQLDAALNGVNEALLLDSGNTQAKALQNKIKQSLERQRFEKELAEARKAIAAKNYIGALDSLKKAEAIDTAAPELATLKRQAMQLREAKKSGRAPAPIELRPAQAEPSAPPVPKPEPRPAEVDSSLLETVRQPMDATLASVSRDKTKFTPPANVRIVEPVRVDPAPLASLGAAAQPSRQAAPQTPARPLSQLDARPKPAPKPHWVLRALGIGVAVLTILSALISVYEFVLKKTENPVTVNIVSTPVGASIHVAGNGRNVDCVTPNCILSLPKGKYEISATLKEYTFITQTIDATENMPPLAITLTRAPTVTAVTLPAPAPSAQPASNKPAPPPIPPQPKDKAGEQWEKIKASNDRNLVRDFLERNPSGPYAEAARARLDDLDWAAANGSDDRFKLQAYLNQHGDGHYVTQAREQIEELDWNTARRSRDPSKIQAYLDRYANARYERQAHDALEQIDWEAARNSRDPKRLQEFLDEYPQSRFAPSAKEMIAKLAPRPSAPPVKPATSAPPYCPLPSGITFDYDTPNRDKIGIWKGAWEPNGRRFCVIITSLKSGEAQGIYSTDSAGNSPAAWRRVTGAAVSTQPRAMTITFSSAGDDRIVMLQFRGDGAVKANWSQGSSDRNTLSAWVTKVK
jgi:hypothetical protein